MLSYPSFENPCEVYQSTLVFFVKATWISTCRKEICSFPAGTKLYKIARYLATNSFPFMFQADLTPKGH